MPLTAPQNQCSDHCQEKWADVPGYESCYQVSDHGRVRSVDRVINGVHYRGKLLAQRFTVAGYPKAALTSRDHVRHEHGVHQLVLLAFIGSCPDGQEVLHLDHNPGNCHLGNLKYGTRGENIAMDWQSGGSKRRAREAGIRARALAACGHADWRRCWICKQWDSVDNLNSKRAHRHCDAEWHRKHGKTL